MTKKKLKPVAPGKVRTPPLTKKALLEILKKRNVRGIYDNLIQEVQKDHFSEILTPLNVEDPHSWLVQRLRDYAGLRTTAAHIENFGFTD